MNGTGATQNASPNPSRPKIGRIIEQWGPELGENMPGHRGVSGTKRMNVAPTKTTTIITKGELEGTRN